MDSKPLSGRPVRFLTLLLSSLLLGACGDSEAPVASVDPRVADLFADCGANARRFYDRNTSQAVEILVEKLQTGSLEVVRRAREELGRLGAASVEELVREVDRHYANPMHKGRLENALVALGLNEDSGAREPLLRGLHHPNETVHTVSLEGLLNHHVVPQDFDLFVDFLEAPIAQHSKRAFARALFQADPERALDTFVGWLERGERAELQVDILPFLSKIEDAELAGRAFDQLDEAMTLHQPHLAAAAARFEVEGGSEALDEFFRHARLELRTSAVTGAAEAGLFSLLPPLVAEEPNPELRIILLDRLANSSTDQGTVRTLLEEGLADPSPRVRNHALRLGLLAGFDFARAQALEWLDGNTGFLQAALDAWRARFDEVPTPEEFKLVRERLIARFEREDSRTLSDRGGILKGIGLCPGEASARYLRELGIREADTTLEGLRVHQWTMIQASNSGPAGLDYLLAEFEKEADEARRIDLLSALASTRGERARERLLAVAEGEASRSGERLLAAKSLVQLGHAEETATRLKRVLNELSDDDPAKGPLRCLLWAWF